MRNERDVKAEIKKILKEHDAWFFMPVPTGFGVQGVPDFVVCYRGKFLGVEAKFGKNKQSEWQKKQEAGIVAARGEYMVINERNLDTLSEWLVLNR